MTYHEDQHFLRALEACGWHGFTAAFARAVFRTYAERAMRFGDWTTPTSIDPAVAATVMGWLDPLDRDNFLRIVALRMAEAA